MPEFFESKRFDVEHALNMYASSFIFMPATAIYEDNMLNDFKENIKDCHIYIIGIAPKVHLDSVVQKGSDLVTAFSILGKSHDLHWPLPPESRLAGDGHNGWYVVDSSGQKFFPSQQAISVRLRNLEAQDFRVLYIGQAFGEDGSRHALDRLKSHSTLQKISIQGIPNDHILTVIMLEIEPANRLISVFNPHAKDNSQGEKRIEDGLSKMFGTSEAERTTLYEASLIRYFKPKFNKEFKNSFPSTNMKLLSDCYEKDIAAVIAEISFDHFPFRLYSDDVEPKVDHIAHHDLHRDEDRKVFFSTAG